jgi:DNA-nicking Smr family endonuclease
MELDKVIRKLRPNKEFVIYGNTLEGLQFMDNKVTQPTQDEIEITWAEIKEDELNKLNAQESARQALLDRLGITAEEAQLLLNG